LAAARRTKIVTMIIKPWKVVTMLVAITATCGATLEFSALLQVGKETRFVVTDAETGRSSGWITLGRAFGEHALVFFDPENEILSLRTSGDIVDLPLQPAFSGGRADPDEMRTQILKNLLPLSAAAEKYFSEKQVTEVAVRELAQHFNLRLPTSVDGEDYPTLVLRPAVAMTIKTRSGIEIAYPEDLEEVRPSPK
jgi:hypothetical protein